MPEETSSLLQQSTPSMASHTCGRRGCEHPPLAGPPPPLDVSSPSAHLQPAAASSNHDEVALQLQAPDRAGCAGGPGQRRGALLGRSPVFLRSLGQRGAWRGRAQGRHAHSGQALLLVHTLHQAAEVIARVPGAAAARPVPRLGLSGLRGQLH